MKIQLDTAVTLYETQVWPDDGLPCGATDGDDSENEFYVDGEFDGALFDEALRVAMTSDRALDEFLNL
jgi:hypothetical protein